jgi:hypothetical protein
MRLFMGAYLAVTRGELANLRLFLFRESTDRL